MSRLKTNAIRHITASSDALTLDSSGNTTNESDLTVVGEVQIGNTSNHTKELRFADATRVDASSIKVDNSNANLLITNDRSGGEIKFATNSTERVSITDSGISIANGNIAFGTSGNGLTFTGADGTGMTFTKYERGSWTPNDGSGTAMATATGRYVRIGNLIYVAAVCTFGSRSGGTTLAISGLPYTNSNNASAGGYIKYTNVSTLADATNVHFNDAAATMHFPYLTHSETDGKRLDWCGWYTTGFNF
tara:strand:+ start:63 stop:806 length:744 start_codon:yes stop_codon:yes gene_type:complete